MPKSDLTQPVLKLEPPFYGAIPNGAGLTADQKSFPADQFLDDVWAQGLNVMLRATIEAGIDPFELRR